ncbi:MAG: DUF2238 domain-containing protein [Alphaproteobacteria bacterium]
MKKYDSIFHLFLAICTILFMVWSKYDCLDHFIWWLEAAAVIIGLPILIITYNKFPLTNLCYILIWTHGLILLIGAHYTYEKVPLFDYFKFEFSLSRNYFDRVGHFFQGFVPAIITRELLIRTSALKNGKWLSTLIVMSVLGISALYEIFEWIVGDFTGESAAGFLALQGDIWDTQKDMVLAGIGATLSLLSLGRIHDKQLSKLKS